MSKRLQRGERLRPLPLQLPARYRQQPKLQRPDSDSSEDEVPPVPDLIPPEIQHPQVDLDNPIDFLLDHGPENIQNNNMQQPQAPDNQPAAANPPAVGQPPVVANPPAANQDAVDPMRQITRDIKALNLSPLNPSSTPDMVNEYLRVFRTRVRMYDLPLQRASTIFVSYLSGDHLIFYESLPDAVKNNFDQLMAAFSQRFVTKDQFTMFNRRNLFYQCSQHVTESPEQYSVRLRSLGRLLNINDDEIKNKFLASLLPEIQSKLMLFQPPDLTSAISYAEEAYRHTTNAMPQTSFNATPTPTTDCFAAIMAKLDQMSINDKDEAASNPSSSTSHPRPAKQVRFSSPRMSRSPSPSPSFRRDSRSRYYDQSPPRQNYRGYDNRSVSPYRPNNQARRPFRQSNTRFSNRRPTNRFNSFPRPRQTFSRDYANRGRSYFRGFQPNYNRPLNM